MINKTGFEIIDNALANEQVDELLQGIESVGLIQASGIRHIQNKSAAVKQFCQSPQIVHLAERYLQGQAHLVRAIFFNKTPSNNWLVTWHQDKTVAVSDYFEAPGWGPWSEKEGVLHVQPPLEVLERMITLRCHLDAATLDNGCLRVIAGSHRQGLLSQNSIAELVASDDMVDCLMDKGAILAMRPHLLHASSKARVPSRRRVLHLEYSDYRLPEGVAWA